MPSDQPCLQVQATSKLQARSRPLGFKGFLVLLHGQHFNYLYFKVNLKSCWPRDGKKLGDPGLKDLLLLLAWAGQEKDSISRVWSKYKIIYSASILYCWAGFLAQI